MSKESTNTLRTILMAVLAGLAAMLVAAVSFGAPVQAVPITHEVADACDVQVVPVGDGVPGDPKVIEAAPGDSVRLTADSNCVPVIGDVFNEKTQVFEPGLVSGDGISLAAPGVTLDLNGHNLHSTKDVLAQAEAQGLDVENAGVSVGAQNVTVTNSSATNALVDNFTANFDFGKGSKGSSLLGGDLDNNSATPRVQNVVGGDAHGGGVLAIDRTQDLTIDGVRLVDLAVQQVDAIPGDNGIDWKRCTGSAGTLKNSTVQGPVAGMRVRGCTSGGLRLLNNSIGSGDPAAGVGIEFTRDIRGGGPTNPAALVSGNTISNNGEGVSIRPVGNQFISVTGNFIRNNSVCGATIKRILPQQGIRVEPNTWASNGTPPSSALDHTTAAAGQDVCTN